MLGSVLRLGRIKVVRDIVWSIQLDIFEQSVGANGTVNVRLGLLRQVDGLGIATTFKIENAVVIPVEEMWNDTNSGEEGEIQLQNETRYPSSSSSSLSSPTIHARHHQ